MRKQIPLFLLLIVILLLSVSIWNNHSFASEKERLSDQLLSRSFYSLLNISRNLDALLSGIPSESTLDEDYEGKLILLSKAFTELHVSLEIYASNFSSRNQSRNSYSGFPNLDLIGWTLVGKGGEINDNPYRSILFDNAISDKEIQYLTALKDDVDNLVFGLASEEDPYQMKEHLSPSHIDRVLKTFTDKWSPHNTESPLKLLYASYQ